MRRIQQKWLVLLLGCALALGVFTGCGNSSSSSAGGNTGGSSKGSSGSSPAKIANAINGTIGEAKITLQELTIPEQKNLATISITSAGSKFYMLTNPTGGDKAIFAYDLSGAVATADQKFGKDGKLTEPKGLISYANNISASSSGELFISNQSNVAMYKNGKVEDLLKNVMNSCNVTAPAAPLPAILVWSDLHVKMGILMDGKLPPEGMEPMPADKVPYKNISYVTMGSTNDPHVYVSGELDNKLNTIINVDSKLQYGNPTDKKAPDHITWKLRMFTVTSKYVVAYDSGDSVNLWSLDGKFLGHKELTKLFPKKQDVDYTCQSICAAGDNIYMAINSGKFGEDKITKIYALKVG